MVRSLPALTLALLAASQASCAARGRPAAPAEDPLETGDRASPSASAVPSGGAADVACAREVRALVAKVCDDAPASMPEGFALRARNQWSALARRCEGPRAREALRRLDECVGDLESDPSQIDAAIEERRQEARARVPDLKADPLYPRAARKLRSAIQEADQAAADFKAEARNADRDALRFRLEAWTQCEKDARDAERELLELITRYGIDPRDAQALGLR